MSNDRSWCFESGLDELFARLDATLHWLPVGLKVISLCGYVCKMFAWIGCFPVLSTEFSEHEEC